MPDLLTVLVAGGVLLGIPTGYALALLEEALRRNHR